MKFIRRHIKLLFILTLPVYLYIVQSTISNKHSHVDANGVVYVHAHPTDSRADEPVSEHEHSRTEVFMYNSLQLDYYDVAVSEGIQHFLHAAEANFPVDEFSNHFFTYYALKSSRAPPV